MEISDQIIYRTLRILKEEKHLTLETFRIKCRFIHPNINIDKLINKMIHEYYIQIDESKNEVTIYQFGNDFFNKHLKKIKRDMATSKWKNKSHFDFLTWDEFEQLIANLFKNTGYDVFLTKKSNDQGADIIGETIYEKIVVQAKFRKNKKNVGVSAVQEIHAARGVYGATRAIAICTSGFTKSAKKMAQKLGVELWDRAILLAELKRINFW